MTHKRKLFLGFCFSALVSTAFSQFYTDLQQITFSGKRSGEGYFSGDDSKLVYQSENVAGNPFYQIYTLDLRTGQTRLVSNEIGKTTCAWFHPNNVDILYSSTHLDPLSRKKQEAELENRIQNTGKKYSWDYDKNYDLFLKNIETNNLRRLTYATGYDAEGSISSDGKKIVFTSNRNIYRQGMNLEREHSYYCDLFLLDLDKNETQQLTDTPGYDGGPFFNSDNTRICWRRFSENGHTAEIFTMDLNNKVENKITDLGVMSWAPYFHPSNDYIIFSNNLHGFNNFELYIVDRSGRGEPVRVTKREGFDGLPTFSNDGNTLSWTSNNTASGNSQIFTAVWNHDAAIDALKNTFSKSDHVSDYQSSSNISQFDLSYYTEILCSDLFEGRMTGTKGMEKANQFVAQELNSFGLRPWQSKSWVQKFSFLKKFAVDESSFLKIDAQENIACRLDSDWTPMNFSENGKLTFNEICFAGYGLRVKPNSNSEGYDSYTHLDVANKWVMVLDGLPPHITDTSVINYFSNPTQKASLARNLGAQGIIFVNSENNDTTKQIASNVDHSLTIKSFVLSRETASLLFNSNGRKLSTEIEKFNNSEPVLGFTLKNFRVNGDIKIKKERGECHNTLGWLRSGKKNNDILVIGAHLDHLGRSNAFSRRKSTDKRDFHPGADDNISGIAALLEIAHKLSLMTRSGSLDLKFDILFGFWSGEEIGLLGSSHFIKTWYQQEKAKNIIAYINMDMVGRYKDKLTIHGIGSANKWAAYIQQANIPIGLNLNLQRDSFIPTDTTSFITKKIPIISGFTGLHSDYHSPSDTPEKLNYSALNKCAQLFKNITLNVNHDNNNLKYVAQVAPNKSRSRLKSYLGTIPDYGSSDVKGVAISGVTSGGPAEKAGLKSEDIVMQLGEEKVESIYDYTRAIGNTIPNKQTYIIIQRENQRIELKITPTARK